jgi:hypothetical protein
VGFFGRCCCDMKEEEEYFVVGELRVEKFGVGGGKVEGADGVGVEVAREGGKGWGVREAVDVEVRCRGGCEEDEGRYVGFLCWRGQDVRL